MTDELNGEAAAPERKGRTRAELLRRAGVGAAAAGVLGGPAAKYAFAGPMRYAKRELKGELKILQWSHFVPAYDTWLDNVYIPAWSRKNDVQVTIDHINNTEIPARAAAEVAAQSGHDLVQFLSPPSSYQNQVVPVNEAVQEVTKKLGQMTDVAYRSTYNPRTKNYFGFPDNYVPDPIHYRHSLWYNAGVAPNTWDHVRQAAAKLKASGHPIGIGMSNELDSDMAMIALMQCFGSYIQDENANVTINSKNTVDALNTMAEIYKNGETNEVFAWTPSSNNQAFLAGRISLAVNAISIARSAEDLNAQLSDDTWIAPIPMGTQRLGLEHVMGVYVIWKFAPNRQNAMQYLVDQQLDYKAHFLNSKFYNFPGWTNAVPGGFKGIRKYAAADKHKPLGKYTILTTIAEKYTANVGHPGFSNAAIDEVFSKFLIPQMFAQVAQGKMTAQQAAAAAEKEIKPIFAKWRALKLI